MCSWVALVAVGAPAAEAATYKSCEPVVNPYAGSGYEGVDLSQIRALRVTCATARRTARGAHRRAIGTTPPENGIREFMWNGWEVTGDLRGISDRYVAIKGRDRVRWRF